MRENPISLGPDSEKPKVKHDCLVPSMHGRLPAIPGFAEGRGEIGAFHPRAHQIVSPRWTAPLFQTVRFVVNGKAIHFISGSNAIISAINFSHACPAFRVHSA
jgi:hypothetical protein